MTVSSELKKWFSFQMSHKNTFYFVRKKTICTPICVEELDTFPEVIPGAHVHTSLLHANLKYL